MFSVPHPPLMALWLTIAVFAGTTTTLVGMGGGTLLLLSLVATSTEPSAALAATSVGLLAGNVHRAWLYRSDVDTSIARPLVFGALPAAVVVGFMSTSAPPPLLRGAIAAVALAGVIATASGLQLRPPPIALGTAGATVGAVSASTGAGGLLAGPLLLSTGLTGRAYVATGATMAVAIHVGRLLGYGGGGVLAPEVLRMGLLFAVAIPLGNLLGHRLRPLIAAQMMRPLELGVAASLAGLAVVGLT